MSNATSNLHSKPTSIFSNKMPPITRQLAFNNTYDNPYHPIPQINLTDEVNLDNEILFRSSPNISNTSQITQTQDKKTSKKN